MACTVPKILGFRVWFEKYHKTACDIHDAIYDMAESLTLKDKFESDFSVSWSIIKRGFKLSWQSPLHILLGLLAIPYTTIGALPYWYNWARWTRWAFPLSFIILAILNIILT